MRIISPARTTGQTSSNPNLIHLWVSVDVSTEIPPSQVRQRFAGAIRQAIARGCIAGRIDQAVAEELFRAVPEIL